MKITEDMIRKARQADIVQLCREMGEVLIPENPAKGEWRIKGKQGLIICQNYYYWHGSPHGNGKLEGQPPTDANNTLSFGIYYFGMRFTNAVIYLSGGNFTAHDTQATYQKAQAKEIIAPPPALNNDRIIEYLTTKRKIDEKIVLEAIQRGLLYQEKSNNNCVFVCKDLNGVITGYEVKGILSTKRFWRNYGNGVFHWLNGEPKKLFVFESAIDLLSFYELESYKKIVKNALLCSMGGVAKMEQVKQIATSLTTNNEKFKTYIATDEDKAGDNFWESFKTQNPNLKAVGVSVRNLYKLENDLTIKDWNDYLIYKKTTKEDD